MALNHLCRRPPIDSMIALSSCWALLPGAPYTLADLHVPDSQGLRLSQTVGGGRQRIANQQSRLGVWAVGIIPCVGAGYPMPWLPVFWLFPKTRFWKLYTFPYLRTASVSTLDWEDKGWLCWTSNSWVFFSCLYSRPWAAEARICNPALPLWPWSKVFTFFLRIWASYL